MKYLVVLILVALVLVAGCVTETGPTDTTGPASGEEPAILSEVSSDLSEVDATSSNLDLSGLENLDSQLEDINW